MIMLDWYIWQWCIKVSNMFCLDWGHISVIHRSTGLLWPTGTPSKAGSCVSPSWQLSGSFGFSGIPESFCRFSMQKTHAAVGPTSRSLKHGVWNMEWNTWCGDATPECRFVFFLKILPSPNRQKNMLNIQICMVFYDKSVIEYDFGTSPKTNIAEGHHHF